MSDYTDWGDSQGVYLLIDAGDGGPPRRLRTYNGLIQVQAGEPAPVILQTGSTVVSTLTHLTGWLDIGSLYERILFYGNTDGSDVINLLVETSEDGAHADVAQLISVMNGGMQASIDVTLSTARFYRLSAYTNTPFPADTVNWGIKAVPRVGS